MQRRNFLLSAAAIAGGLALSACGGSDSTTSTGASGSAAPAADGDTLIVYTNSNADGRAEWVTEQAKAAGMTIKIVGQGGGDTTNKLKAEKANPVADVVFGLNNMYFEDLVANDLVDKYEPNWSGEVDKTFASKDGYYWPIVKQGIVLVHDAKLTGANAPSDWTDLWTKPEFKGKYEVPTGLGGATTQLMFAGILTRYKDEGGDLGVSDEGWKQIEAYFANGSPAVQDKDMYARIAAGEVIGGQMWTSGILSREKQYNVKTTIVKPSAGVPFAVEQIALVKGTKRADLAKKFIDWFGSAEVQGDFAAKFDSAPVNKGAVAKANKDAVALVDGLTPQEIDWTFAQQNMPEWVEKVTLEYLK